MHYTCDSERKRTRGTMLTKNILLLIGLVLVAQLGASTENDKNSYNESPLRDDGIPAAESSATSDLRNEDIQNYCENLENKLPRQVSNGKMCQNSKITCQNLKKTCDSKFGSASFKGITNRAKKCLKGLWKKDRETVVKEFCKQTCKCKCIRENENYGLCLEWKLK